MQPVGSEEQARRRARRELEERMAGPQRHRLLHGFPMAPLMTPIALPDAERLAPFDAGERPLLVGVLPHPFCNPRVRGCGFCTFPHQAYRNRTAREVTERVVREVRAFAAREPALCASPVEALYFGGATANLTPPDAFTALAHALAGGFELSSAEVTLEGVPAYFGLHDGVLLDTVERVLAPARRRISMGVQTFDRAGLRAMGRDAFGGREEVEAVVRRAGRADVATSADLLVNLPHQSDAAMLEDVRIAIGAGLDQICIYHLVAYAGLGTAWSEDPSMLAGLPDNERAFVAWSAVRELLLSSGYVQTTLTNFERADAHAGARRFRYEPASFAPWRFDALGFGPAAITTVTDATCRRAVKWTSTADAEAYCAAIDEWARAWTLGFDYAPIDVELLHLTRGLAALRIDRRAHAARFGDPTQRFGAELEALVESRLVELDQRELCLTPRGMFFADSVTGLLAARRARTLRRHGAGRPADRDGKRRLNAAAPHHMG